MQSRRRQDTVSTSNHKLNITERSKSVRESLEVKNKTSFRKKKHQQYPRATNDHKENV